MGIVGDSKSQTGNSWPQTLITQLDNVGDNIRWSEDIPRNWAVGGYNVSALKSSIDTYLLEHTNGANITGNVFLINLGANDVSALPEEATLKADYIYIIDAILAQYPLATIYLVKPWKRDHDAFCDIFAGWIDDIVGLYLGNVLVGHDERIWMKGVDNGVTMSDGTHYSTAGQTECAAQWYAILHP